YIEDACNAEVNLDLELYNKRDILSLVSVAIDTTKTNGQRFFVYSKSCQNGARFLTVANRAQRLLSVLKEFPIPQFRYITPNWLYHLT
ncbi:7041_t:CDS:2, partial [Diversispora eburnea]